MAQRHEMHRGKDDGAAMTAMRQLYCKESTRATRSWRALPLTAAAIFGASWISKGADRLTRPGSQAEMLVRVTYDATPRRNRYYDAQLIFLSRAFGAIQLPAAPQPSGPGDIL